MKKIVTQSEINNFRDGIFEQRTRRLGTVAEIMIEKIFSLEKSSSIYYDREDNNGNKIEIKFSLGLKKNPNSITSFNILEQIDNSTIHKRAIKSNEAKNVEFDCNIQQVKLGEFNYLYYGIFFYDCVEIYKVSKDDINTDIRDKCGYFSDYQHKDNKGEGQFHVNNKNIQYHRENFRVLTLTYEELYELFKQGVSKK